MPTDVAKARRSIDCRFKRKGFVSPLDSVSFSGGGWGLGVLRVWGFGVLGFWGDPQNGGVLLISL